MSPCLSEAEGHLATVLFMKEKPDYPPENACQKQAEYHSKTSQGIIETSWSMDKCDNMKPSSRASMEIPHA